LSQPFQEMANSHWSTFYECTSSKCGPFNKLTATQHKQSNSARHQQAHLGLASSSCRSAFASEASTLHVPRRPALPTSLGLDKPAGNNCTLCLCSGTVPVLSTSNRQAPYCQNKTSPGTMARAMPSGATLRHGAVIAYIVIHLPAIRMFPTFFYILCGMQENTFCSQVLVFTSGAQKLRSGSVS
jgi:hypothetical protein